MQKDGLYEERGQIIQEILEKDPCYKELRDKLVKELIKDAPTNITKIKQLRDRAEDEHLQFKSAKELLNMAGLGTRRLR